MDHRDFHRGVEETSILSLGLVRSMDEMMLKVLPLKWKGRQRRKLRDIQKPSKKDTKN